MSLISGAPPAAARKPGVVRRPYRCFFPLVLAASLAACAGDDAADNQPPTLAPIGDQVVTAGRELTLALSASDPDGDAVTFRFSSDLPNIGSRTSLETDGAKALFHYTPIATDVGQHAFDFVVSDGSAEARRSVTVDVAPPGEGTAPVFRQPLGTGTTLDLAQDPCVTVPIVVDDPDTPGVQLAEEEPRIAGATLTQASELTGSWQWCPTAADLAADDRFTLVLSADDGDNPKTLKSYLLVLPTWGKPDCPGAAPSVTHASQDQSTVNPIGITAQVTDDLGIKYEPLLYYSTTPPGDPPDLAQMTQLTMTLADGTTQSGTWGVDVPNPVAGKEAGATAELYYVILAQDNDDAAGTCDHRTTAPASGSYAITITSPGGNGMLGPCAPCSADVQCGGDGDHCVAVGGGYHCGLACASDADCPEGHYCSFSELSSIDGATAHQCIPETFVCEAGPDLSCTDDDLEPNDSRVQAALLAAGTYDLVSCPGAGASGDDYYRIELAGDATVTLDLSGGDAADLDLSLLDADGAVVTKSDGLSSSESIEACLGAGTYYVRVYSWGTEANDYTLTYQKAAGSCAPACFDDDGEDDDAPAQARWVDLDLGAYKSETQVICSLDDDWYEVYLYAGDTLHVSLTFLQANAAEDLDIRFYEGEVDLTQCTEWDPFGCDADNGQSADSDETFTYEASASGTYHVVVHGWDGSENLYDLCIGLSSIDCPPP